MISANSALRAPERSRSVQRINRAPVRSVPAKEHFVNVVFSKVQLCKRASEKRLAEMLQCLKDAPERSAEERSALCRVE